MFGKRSLRDQYAGVIKEIEGGNRRSPRHDHPTSIHGNLSRASVDVVDEYFFRQAALFGPTLDWLSAEAWSLEETSDTSRRAWYLDSPDYSRRWIVYYNSLKLGWMEVTATPERLFSSVEDFVQSPRAQIDIELHDVRWVPSEDISGLLTQASLLMQGDIDGAWERGRHDADTAMTRYLWEVARVSDEYVPVLQFSAGGPYSVYRERTAHWLQTGFDVLKKTTSESE